MTINSTPAPKTGRIAGTLHKRGYTHPAPLQDEDVPKEQAEVLETTGPDKFSGQMDHNGAR